MQDRVRAAFYRGEAPATIIKRLLAEGIPPHEVVQILQEVMIAVTADYTTALPQEQPMEQLIVHQLCAGRDDATIQRNLVLRGVPPPIAMRIVADARHMWSHLHARKQAQLRASVVRSIITLSLMSVLLIGGRWWLDTWIPSFGPPTPPVVLVELRPATASRLPAGPNAVVVTETLNVRAGPGTDYPIVRQLHTNEPVRVIGRLEDAGRYLVRLPDDQAAWIRSDPALVRLDVPIDSIPRFV
ncbi:MAG TPA: SH3 domain-containing protein, partial [Herpetosiphonaceae bacterium]